MEPPGGDLEQSLRALALALAEAQDAGWSVPATRCRLVGLREARADDQDLVEDTLLTAAAMLAGVNNDLHGLTRVWGERSITETAAWATPLVHALSRR